MWTRHEFNFHSKYHFPDIFLVFFFVFLFSSSHSTISNSLYLLLFFHHFYYFILLSRYLKTKYFYNSTTQWNFMRSKSSLRVLIEIQNENKMICIMFMFMSMCKNNKIFVNNCLLWNGKKTLVRNIRISGSKK